MQTSSVNMWLLDEYRCELFSNKFKAVNLQIQESAQNWIIVRFPRATGVQYWHWGFTDILTKVNTVYYLLCLRGNSFTLFVGNVVDVFLCVAIIKQTITSVGLGLLILGFPRIADNLTWCNLTIYFIYHM